MADDKPMTASEVRRRQKWMDKKEAELKTRYAENLVKPMLDVLYKLVAPTLRTPDKKWFTLRGKKDVD